MQTFSDVIRTFYISVFRYYFFVTGNKQLAADLTTELFKNVSNFTPQKNLTSFNLKQKLFKDAHNFLQQRNIPDSNLDFNFKQLEFTGFDEDLRDAALVEIIVKLVGNLTNEYREILIFKYIENLNETEIRSILDLSEESYKLKIDSLINYYSNELKKDSNNDNISTGDITILLSKLSRIKQFIPDIRSVDKLVTEFKDEDIDFEKEVIAKPVIKIQPINYFSIFIRIIIAIICFVIAIIIASQLF